MTCTKGLGNEACLTQCPFMLTTIRDELAFASEQATEYAAHTERQGHVQVDSETACSQCRIPITVAARVNILTANNGGLFSRAVSWVRGTPGPDNVEYMITHVSVSVIG